MDPLKTHACFHCVNFMTRELRLLSWSPLDILCFHEKMGAARLQCGKLLSRVAGKAVVTKPSALLFLHLLKQMKFKCCCLPPPLPFNFLMSHGMDKKVLFR